MRGRVFAYLRRHHVALLALFIALGGTSYAAIKLPANSVGPRQLRRHSVLPSKVAPRTIRLFRGQRGRTGPRGFPGLPGPKGARGARGPRGFRGVRGPTGPTGQTGATGAPGAAGASALVGSWIPDSTTGTDLGPPLGTAQAAASVAGGASDNDVAALSPAVDTVGRDLAVTVAAAPGTGNSWAVTLRVNGADTALTCTIAGSATSCDSGATTAAIAKKSKITFKIQPSGSPPSATLYYGWRLTTP